MKSLQKRFIALFLCFAMIFTSVNITNLFNKRLNATDIELSTNTTVSSKDGMTDIEYIVGRFQFNYCGASNGWCENGDLTGSLTSSGFSHIPEAAKYESGTYANSSGSYLDGSYNKNGTIHKAYLTIESSGISSYYNYPITLVYAGEDGIPKNSLKTKMQYFQDSPVSPGYNDFGWIDVTDFVKENGYGWYYCCNIPTVLNTSDCSADWKLVVIEENQKLPVRMLKLQFGTKWGTDNSYQYLTIQGSGITTKKQGTVTGQFLYNISNQDGINKGRVRISTDGGSNYLDVISTNGLRTASSPLVLQKTRNTKPIATKTKYANGNYYYLGNNNTSLSTSSGFQLIGSDVELLDIDGTTKYHNIVLKNNQQKISLAFNPYPAWLVTNILGMSVDIDCPEYTSSQTAKNHDKYYVTINGTTTNTSTQTEGIGMKNGEVLVTVDDGLKILSTTAYFTSANGTKTNLTSDMYEIDYDNNTIKYIYGPNTNGQSTVGESLTYEIETFAIESDNNDGYKYTANNTVQASGYLVSNNVATDYFMDNVAWNESSSTIDNPASVVINDLIINPNGGTYKGSTSNTTIKDVQSRTNVKVETPVRDKYTFTGWKIEGNKAEVVDKNNIIMGSEDTTITAQWTPNPLRIDATPNNDGFGSVTVDWSTYDYADKNFKVYKSEDGTNYESVGIDYTTVKEVKVLQVYPVSEAQNQLKTWMNTNGYGKDLMKIENVYLNDFNSNPYKYLTTDGTASGDWKYDVLFFGTWDQASSYDISASAAKAVESYIKSGRGVILGHDTITINGAGNTNYNSLAHYFGLGLNTNLNTNRPIDTVVQIRKKGLFTTYPWEIGDVGTKLNIPQTHNRGQYVTNATIWLDFPNFPNFPSSSGNFYLATYNNCAMIMTGHSNGAATADEQKILANLIFYCNQLLFNTYTTNDMSAQDYTAPNKPTITDSNNTYNFSTKDLGNDYHYYVESYDKNDTTTTGLLETSNIDIVHVETGLKGYHFVADNNASTSVTKDNEFIETSSVSLSQIAGNKYLHVAAVDNAGNLSATTTIELPYTNTYTVNHYIQNLDGTYTLKETITDAAVIETTITLAVKTYEGFKSPTAKSIKITVDSNNIVNYYYERNKYTVTYVDVIDSENGTVLNTKTEQAYYGKTVNGSDLGNIKTDNEYYNGYYLNTTTGGTVTTNGITVYRIFKLRTVDVVGSVKWIDNSNKHNTRPSEVYIYLLKDGKTINQVKGLTSTNDNAFSFKNLPKYDTTTGKAFTYTVSQSEVESLTNPEDTYKTTQNGYVLTNSLNNFNVEPDPDPINPPEVKDSYEIKGNISWVDNDDNLGYRPYDIKLTLYKDGVEYASGVYTVDSSKNSFDYAFTNLPKYNENLELHKYTVVQEFQNKSLLTWDESSKKLIEIDAYTTKQTNFNFVNNLADIEDEPIIEVKPEHVNTLNLKLEFNSLIDWKPLNISKEDVDLIITLKQLETVIVNNNPTYTNKYNEMTYNTMLTNNGITINNIPSGKYEITTQNSLFELENIKLSNASNMTIVKENGKDYLIIDSTNTNNNGTITFTLNVKDHNGYQTSEGRNNLYQ